MERLQIQLAIGLYRNIPRRRAFDGFRNRMRIPEVILVTLPERFGIGWRHLLDLVTERDQLTRDVVRGHAGFDADEARRHVHKSCGNLGPRHLFAQNDRAFLDPGQSYAACSYRYRYQWCGQLRRRFCWAWRVLLVLLKPPTDSACRWGQEHGRSIPFATLLECLLSRRDWVRSGHDQNRPLLRWTYRYHSRRRGQPRVQVTSRQALWKSAFVDPGPWRNWH